ncbi:MAG: hypothetical protein RL632_757 [Bacteroidota bacterium]|jgi:hypothetical protein
MKPPFHLRESPTDELLELLDETVLGTSGARYRHLDTRDRVFSSDNPLFLTLERTNKVLANLTFCRRGTVWYIRFFAFKGVFQSKGKSHSSEKREGLLKNELSQFFGAALNGNLGTNKVDSFYAYIDPRNERSKWMSENFGFRVAGHLVTQSFSRVSPKSSKTLRKLDDWNLMSTKVRQEFSKHTHYDEAHISNPPFYVLLDEKGDQLAGAHVMTVRWQIERLPGNYGAVLTKLIPFIPFLRKLIQPKNHQFIVPDCVWTKHNDPQLLQELFSAILHEEKLNLMLWWTDEKDALYQNVKNKVQWGLFHQLVGAAPVDVVVLDNERKDATSPFFVKGWDMV